MKVAIKTTQRPLPVEAQVAHSVNIPPAHLQVAFDLTRGGTLPKEADVPMEALHRLLVTLRRKQQGGLIVSLERDGGAPVLHDVPLQSRDT